VTLSAAAGAAAAKGEERIKLRQPVFQLNVIRVSECYIPIARVDKLFDAFGIHAGGDQFVGHFLQELPAGRSKGKVIQANSKFTEAVIRKRLAGREEKELDASTGKEKAFVRISFKNSDLKSQQAAIESAGPFGVRNG
jgi:hypothetical protein